MDKQKQVKHSLIYIVPKMVTAVFSILALAIYTRFLTKYDFGVFALAEVCAVFLSGVVNFGMLLGFERDFFKYEDEAKRKELLYSTLFFVMIMFGFIGGIAYMIRNSLSKWIVQSGSYGNLVFILFCSTVFVSLNQYYYFYFRSEEKPEKFVFYTVMFNILNVVFPVLLIVFANKGLMGLACGQLFAALLVFIFLGIRFLRETPFSVNFAILKEVFKISYPLTPRIFFGVISSKINTYILAVMNSVSGAGLLSVAQRFSYMVFIFMTTIQNVFNPVVYKKMFSKEEKAGYDIGKFLTPFLYWSVAFALVMSLFAKEILYTLTAQDFHGAANIMTVLSLYYAMLFFSKITSLQLIFRKKTFTISFLTIFTIAVNVVLAIPLAKSFGAIGAAWAILLGGIITGCVSFVIAQRFFRIEWEVRKVMAMFTVLIGSSVFVIVSSYTKLSYGFCFGFKALSFLLYFYIGIKMNILTKENLHMLKNIITFKNKSKMESSIGFKDKI